MKNASQMTRSSTVKIIFNSKSEIKAKMSYWTGFTEKFL